MISTKHYLSFLVYIESSRTTTTLSTPPSANTSPLQNKGLSPTSTIFLRLLLTYSVLLRQRHSCPPWPGFSVCLDFYSSWCVTLLSSCLLSILGMTWPAQLLHTLNLYRHNIIFNLSCLSCLFILTESLHYGFSLHCFALLSCFSYTSNRTTKNATKKRTKTSRWLNLLFLWPLVVYICSIRA